ncbi:hypothetical protein CCMA1212_001505 [Trichoderma ghanense]|uniref:F-box domain-containing protein n=1 Tax=Trichoderma ghanense TaxID=65468 RepID=A0ABY2HG89_9HYPO
MVGGHDVSSLTRSADLDEEEDEFGKEEEDTRLPPLLLPKLMDGGPTASKSLLLSLPPEILGYIMDLLVDDRASLSALAFVNSDCRQLARSCQFADVCFDYGPSSSQLLSHLVREECARRNCDTPGTLIRPPFLGSCIRRVTVRSDRDYVADTHCDLDNSIRGDTARTITAEERAELRKAATEYYFGTRCASLLAAMSAMPNIETLSWYDRMCLDKDFFKCVTNLPLRRLKICKAYISDPYCLDSLAPLEHLTLRCMPIWGAQTLSFGHERVVFDRLWYLNLSSCYDDLDRVAWCSLLSAPLRHLALPCRSPESLIQAIHACQPLRHLETLVLPSFGYKDATEAPPILEFISAHSHVRKLSVQHGEPKLMDSYLVPLLSDGRWSNLTSLSLGWHGPWLVVKTQQNIATISAKSLATIGSIKSLEQLYLTAGETLGCRHQWLIDHKLMRSSLRGLTKLKSLAFSRDTYSKPGVSGALVESYYEYRFASPEEQDIAMERPYLDRLRPTMRTDEGSTDDDMLIDFFNFNESQVWERAHRNRMLREAERYSRALPSLEWIYCGQRPMGFRPAQTSKGKRRIAVPLSRERDFCHTLLGRMFAMGEDDDQVW